MECSVFVFLIKFCSSKEVFDSSVGWESEKVHIAKDAYEVSIVLELGTDRAAHRKATTDLDLQCKIHRTTDTP